MSTGDDTASYRWRNEVGVLVEIKLSERFRESRGEPINYGDKFVHMMIELPPISEPSVLRVVFHRASALRPQGLRLKVRGGHLEINGQRLDDIVLWSDSSPEETEAPVSLLKPGKPVTLRMRNSWRDQQGTLQAWTGNAGILREERANGVLLSCSDGFGQPDFDDLIVEIRMEALRRAG